MKTKFFRRNELKINLFFIWLIIMISFFPPGSIMGQTAAGETQGTENDQSEKTINELKNQIGNLTATEIEEVNYMYISDKTAVFKIKLGQKSGYLKMRLINDDTRRTIDEKSSDHFVNEHIIKFDNLKEDTRYSYEVQLIDKSGAKIIGSNSKSGAFSTKPLRNTEKKKKCYKIECIKNDPNNFIVTAKQTNSTGDNQEKMLLEIKIVPGIDRVDPIKRRAGKWCKGNNGQDKIYVTEGSPKPIITIPWETFNFNGKFDVHGTLYNEDGTNIHEDNTISAETKKKRKIEKPKFISPVSIKFTPIDTIISWQSDIKANSHIEIKGKGRKSKVVTEPLGNEETDNHTHYLLKSEFYESFISQKKLNFILIMENPLDKEKRNESEIVISFDFPTDKKERDAFVKKTKQELKSGIYKLGLEEAKISSINTTLKSIEKGKARKGISGVVEKMLPFVLKVFLPTK